MEQYYFDFFKALPVYIASGVAIYGINSWRREITWRKRYELSEEVLTLLYEVEDIFRIIRSPFANNDEGKTRPKGGNESSGESSLRDRAYTVYERYEKHKDSFNKLRSIKYRFMAVYGKESETHFAKIEQLLFDLHHASWLLGDIYWQNQGVKEWKSDAEFQKHLKEMHANEEIIWYMGKDDKFSKKVSEIIKEIEVVCERKNNR